MLRRRIVLDDLSDLLFIRRAVFLKQVVCVCLGWRFRIDFIEKHLDAEKNLLDCDGRLPAFFFVQDAETDCTGWVDVRVEEWRNEFAFWWLSRVFCNTSD